LCIKGVGMDFERIKNQANKILNNRAAECNYIEYKKSADQLPRILKTICAYGNNYYDNDIQFMFIGVEEQNDGKNKAIPILPITGIEEGFIEKCKNQINYLRSFLYPNVNFELLTHEINGKKYILIVVPRQTGGPFMVSEKAEKDKKLKLKPGRYIRIEAESRLAKVDEEYDLLRKFANFHFSSLVNQEATVGDLNWDYLTEFIQKTSDRKVMSGLTKLDIAQSLKLIDKNDPTNSKVKNYAVLMFANSPEQFIPYAYSELIIDLFGAKQKMESKRFYGPIWKQYRNIVNFINDNYLNVYTLREDGKVENRRLENFPFVAIEELVANAFVHNNYENRKAIQIYISESQINIVNYNKPLPPLKISDLNERRIFNERDTENPEIRNMFKSLGIIESFGTGIGEAKRAMEENGSPKLYYKIFPDADNVTSVVIPVNEEYRLSKSNLNPGTNNGTIEKPQIKSESLIFKDAILGSKYNSNTKNHLLNIYDHFAESVFKNTDIVSLLGCSQTTATTYIKKLNDLKITVSVTGKGKGNYCFKSKLES